MADLRRIVIDVLKPHDPPIVQFTERIAGAASVEGVSVSLVELDQDVQNVKLTVEGEAVDYESVEASIEELGATVHSVDEVAAGSYIVEDRRTLQDN